MTSRSAQPPRIGRSRAWWHDYLDHPEHGPLPALLLVLTVATGLIDAVSILGLGLGRGLTSASGSPVEASTRNAAVALAAIALGLQNAAVRRLAVPDLTTTVLTMTLTGVAADLRQRNLRVALRRIASVAAMLIGAVVGAVIVLHDEVSAALFAARVLLAAVAAGAVAAARSDASWVAGGAR